METALAKLIEYVETISPELWRIFVRQAYNDAITNGIAAVFCLAVAIVAFAVAKSTKERCATANAEKSKYDHGRDDTWDDWYPIFYISVAMPAIFALASLVGMIRILINPEYYAIQSIIKMLGGG